MRAVPVTAVRGSGWKTSGKTPDNHHPGRKFPPPADLREGAELRLPMLTLGARRWQPVREFGELEMAIMDVMWAAESPCVVREVRERLQYGRPVAYTTVMTVMNILHRKGVLHRSKYGRAWRYWPVERREEHDARLMAEALRHFLGRVTDKEMMSFRTAVLDESSQRLALK